MVPSGYLSRIISAIILTPGISRTNKMEKELTNMYSAFVMSDTVLGAGETVVNKKREEIGRNYSCHTEYIKMGGDIRQCINK